MKKAKVLFAFAMLMTLCCILAACGGNWADDYCKYAQTTKTSGEKYYTVIEVLNADTVEEFVVPSEYDGLSVGSIDEGAFKACSKLKKVTLPAAIVDMDKRIFDGCIALEEVVLLSTTLDNDVEAVFAGAGTAEKVVTVTVGEGVTLIPEKLFADAENINIVFANSTPITVADGAFANSTIKNLSVPLNVKEIGYHAYKNTDIKSVCINAGKDLHIASAAFSDCKELASVEINVASENVQNARIQTNAFDGCTALSEIRFSGTMDEWKTIFKGDASIQFKVICSDGEVEYQ